VRWLMARRWPRVSAAADAVGFLWPRRVETPASDDANYLLEPDSQQVTLERRRHGTAWLVARRSAPVDSGAR